MPVHRKSRTRPRRRGWFGRDAGRALGVSLLFGLAATAGVGTVIWHAPVIEIQGAGNGGPVNESLTTGSVILVPVLGNICRKKLIDNATWRIRDHSIIDCRVALAGGAHGGELGWSASRLDVVRDSFYRR